MKLTLKYTPFFLLLLGMAAIESCADQPPPPPPEKNKPTALDSAANVTAYYSEAGKVKGKLTAPIMFVYQGDSSYTEFPHTLHVDFYNDSLIKESQLDARYGRDRSSDNRVFLKDCVVVINVLKGDTLRCQELWWDKTKQKFYTDKPARYSQHDHFTNFGRNGLEAKQDLSDLTFYDNSGTLPVPKDSATAPVGPGADSTSRPNSSRKKIN